jgi:hypothetical protein
MRLEDLPAGYEEALYLRLTKGRTMIWLNLLALVMLLVFLIIFLGWLALYHALGAVLVIDALPDELSALAGVALVLLTLPLHELMHGLFISRYGHKPKYGIKILKGVLYATADGALFRRDEFNAVAMAPFVVISLVMLALSLIFPPGIAIWLMFAATINATGAVGDFWMVVKTLQFPADALVLDVKDGMRIFSKPQ